MLILILWLVAAVLMLATLVLYQQIKNPGIVDVAWGICIMTLGTILLWRHGGNGMTLFYQTLLLIWGMRLSGFIWWSRIRVNHVDPRYKTLLSGWKNPLLGVALNYQLQGVLCVLVAWTFYPTAAEFAVRSGFDNFFGVLALTAIGLEALADWQLLQFKAKKSGSVCDQGLWQYSRHPNYFFEWAFWSLMALDIFFHSLSIFAFSAPVTVYLIMNYITIPMTERQSIATRGEAFMAYQKKTSRFVPIVG